MIGDEPAPRKWLQTKSVRSQSFLPGLRVEAGRAGRAEGDVDAAFFDDRRGRGVAVELVAELRRGDAEENVVAQDLAGLLVHATRR